MLSAGCAGLPAAPDGLPEPPSIRPGQTFRPEAGHHITLSGDYGLPGGTYAVVFTCFGEVDYRIEDRNGQRNGKCKVTGVSNSVTEHRVTGPATLGIAIGTLTVAGLPSYVNVQLSLP
jgi:hypothetical protein